MKTFDLSLCQVPLNVCCNAQVLSLHLRFSTLLGIFQGKSELCVARSGCGSGWSPGGGGPLSSSVEVLSQTLLGLASLRKLFMSKTNTQKVILVLNPTNTDNPQKSTAFKTEPGSQGCGLAGVPAAPGPRCSTQDPAPCSGGPGFKSQPCFRLLLPVNTHPARQQMSTQTPGHLKKQQLSSIYRISQNSHAEVFQLMSKFKAISSWIKHLNKWNAFFYIFI